MTARERNGDYAGSDTLADHEARIRLLETQAAEARGMLRAIAVEIPVVAALGCVVLAFILRAKGGI